MEHNIFYAFVSVFTVSAISLIGLAAISMNEAKLRKAVFLLVALAVGGLLGDAFIHLIPESLEESTDPAFTSLLVITGIILFFVFEKFIGWHHHHEHEHKHHHKEHYIKPLGTLILLSDGLHNLVDGMIIGASYLVSVELGIASTIAIIWHEIPQEIGDFGALLYAGYSKLRALWFNFLSALLAIVGVAIIFLFGENAESLIMWVLPLAAGNFIYIASSDLLPELHKEHKVGKSILEVLMIIAGIGAMYLLTFLEI